MEKNARVLIVVPAHNETGRIGEVVGEIREKLPDIDIVVIDDASSDGTGAEAEAAGSKVVRLPTNLGIGGAVQAGYKYAERHGYDIVVQIDGDGQHDPGFVGRLLEPILEGKADVVIGSRYVPGAKDPDYKTPFARKVGITLFSLLTSAIVGVRITDVTSGFRAVSGKVLRYYVDNYPADFPDSEATILIHYLGGRVREIPVHMRSRAGGRSSTTPIKSLYYPFKVLIAILATLLREKPRVGE
ncbi:MAG: glycosyltransferase family 2 protein [Candidatus Eisenbacteria sp.]|nr:glycosyltransferase family 2 protein [Candidatus Eisenbacteria bacterium]